MALKLPTNSKVPARTLLALTLGGLAILCFVMVFLIPEQREIGRLRESIEATQGTIEEQTVLRPVENEVKKMETAQPAVPKAEGESRLPLQEVGGLTQRFDAMAGDLGVQVANVAPDPSSAAKSGLLAVKVTLRGRPGGFRDFLLALGRWPSLVKIESVGTAQSQDGREYTVKFWLAVK